MNARSAVVKVSRLTNRSGRMPPPPSTTRPWSVWNTNAESTFEVSRPSSAASAWAAWSSSLLLLRWMVRPLGVYQRAVVILERAGDDLRRARGPAVHQDDDGEAGPWLGLGVPIRAGGVGVTAALRHDLLAGIQEQLAHGDSLIQQAARIAAQVEEERLHALLEQTVDGLAELRRRLLAHGREQDVADLVVEHGRDLHRADVDHGAGELERERLLDAYAVHPELHRRSRLAPQLLHGLILLPALGRVTVQRHDLIARLDAGALRRRVRQGRHDGDPAVADLDLDSETAVIPGGGLVQGLEVVSLQEDGVRVVQLVEHAVDGQLVEAALVDRIAVVVGDVREHVFEQACL